MKHNRFVTRIICAALCLLVAALCIPLQSAPAESDGVQYVRVLLSTQNADSLTIPVTGTYTLTEANRTFTNGTLYVRANGGSVTVTHSSEGELYTGSAATIERNNLARNAGSLTVKTASGTRLFLGHFSFTASNGVLQVVNRVPLSHYLYGVVGYEMSNTFPIEALKAQALAAKGYALLRISNSGSYDIGDTASDQVYKGYVSTNTNVIHAVDSTINEVLTYNGAPLQCYYAASNGGWMILPGVRWNDTSFDAAYAKGADSFDMKNPSTPRETIFVPSNYSESQMGTRAFAFLDARLMAVVAGGSILPEHFRFGAIQSIDSVTSSGNAGDRSDLNHTTVTVNATVRADLDPALVPSPTPAHPAVPTATPVWDPTPSPTPEFVMPTPTVEPVPPAEGGEGWTAPTATPVPEIPTPTPAWSPTPSPTPAWDPTPSPTPAIELTREIPVSCSFTFEDMAAAGLFSNSKLKIFYAEPTDGGFYLHHARYGHGVGMSQRGAEQMADEGYSYREILSYYYPGATIGAMSFVSPETVGASTQAGQSAAVTATPATSTGKVINGSVNLRTKPTTSASLLEELPQDTQLTLTGMQGKWYFVSTPGGATGYVHSDYVELTGSGVIATGVVNASAVNLRSGPGTSFNAVTRLSRSTQLGVFGMQNGWYMVKAMTTGDLGFISGDYVTITTSAGTGSAAVGVPTAIVPVITPAPVSTDAAATPTPTLAPVTPSPIPVYAASGTLTGHLVNLRAGASTSTASFGKLDRGTQLGLYEKIGSWYRVRVLSSGQEGFVYAKYISLGGSSAGQGSASSGSPLITPDPTGGQTASTSRGYINAGGVHLRTGSGVNYDSLGRLARNTTVNILGSSGSWLSVEVVSSGTVGYIFAKYVTISGTQPSKTAPGVITARLNLRTAATTGASSRVLTVMPRGAVVTVHSTVNGWCYVTYEGTSGYCISRCVRIS